MNKEKLKNDVIDCYIKMKITNCPNFLGMITKCGYTYTQIMENKIMNNIVSPAMTIGEQIYNDPYKLKQWLFKKKMEMIENDFN